MLYIPYLLNIQYKLKKTIFFLLFILSLICSGQEKRSIHSIIQFGILLNITIENIHQSLPLYIETINYKPNEKNYHSLKENPIKSSKEKKQNLTISIAFILILIIFIIESNLYWTDKINKITIQYKIPSPVLETNSTQKYVQKVSEKKQQKPAIHIPQEILTVVLANLDDFERDRGFATIGLSLADVASKININTKYLTEIIKHYKGKNFNKYINKLRIEYIIEILQNEPDYRKYKIEYLAKVSGFSSRIRFTTTFKDQLGITPSDFIKQLEKN